VIRNDQSAVVGLSEREAAERLRAEGFNELPSTARRSLWAITWDVVREPMFVLLVAGGVLYLVLGDVQEAMMLLAFVFVVMGITLYQERKTERALEALRDLSSPRALVVRGGAERRIAGREVVRGDALVVTEGDRVPADAILLSCDNLYVDESLLTGESAPVRKAAAVAGVVATVVGFLLIFIELVTQQEMGFNAILSEEYIPVIIVNSIAAAIVTPILVLAWEPLREQLGR